MRMRRLPVLAFVLVACSASEPDASPPEQKVPPPTAFVVAPEPPRIADLAFYRGEAGPRVLARGTGTIGELHVELLDAMGAPAALGDEPNAIDLDGPANAGPTFFVEIQAAATIADKVAQIAVTPRDGSGHPGARRVASLSDPPARELGDACDAQGFDRCADGTTCAPGLLSTPNRCERTEALRASRCAAAPLVTVEAAHAATMKGSARGASLWDPMDGCASSERRGRPEGLVWLHVPAGTASVTLATTATFDTVLSVHRACDGEAELACNDDAAGTGSSLVLASPAPGDYLVVVDSLDRDGGDFELRVTTP